LCDVGLGIEDELLKDSTEFKLLKKMQIQIEDSEVMNKLRRDLADTQEAFARCNQSLQLANKEISIFIKEGRDGVLVKRLQQLAILRESRLKQLEAHCNALVLNVIPHVCRTLIASPEFGELLSKVVNISRVDAMKELLNQLEADGHIGPMRMVVPSDLTVPLQDALNALCNADYSYLRQITSNPRASVQELYDVKPKDG